ncbi:MAG: hypothetical protein QM817_02030 [Archangium sp.]
MLRFVLPAVLLLCACPPAIRHPESAQLVLSGTLVAGGFAKRGEPLNDATVTVRDATSGDVLATNTTSSAGGYVITTTVSAKQRVLVVAEASGYAPMIRAITAAPYTEFTISAALSPLDAWECLDTRCTAPLVDLDWADPPMGASGRATGFDAELPLLVDVDATRPPILALGYAEAAGGTDGALMLRIPFAAWPSLVDATPGNGTLEVRAASFDVATAKWSMLAPVPLWSEADLPLPESALGALQRSEFSGGAVARLPVKTKAFLAVLGASTPQGCVRGALKAQDKKAAGATLGYRGFEPASTDSLGAFCVSAPVSTEPQLAVRAQYAGLPYSLGSLKRAAAEGTCESTCTELGTIEVLPEALQLAKMCKFTGKVIDSLGAPVPNAEVVALDETLVGAQVESFCGKSGARCSLTAPSAMDGTFTLNAPLLTSMFVAARATTSSTAGDAQRSTSMRFESCPNEPLTLKLSRGLSRLELTATFTGTQLAWDPPRAASHLVVTDSAGVVKWELLSATGMTSPLTFGVAPAEATVLTAPTGSPASGDQLLVELDGVGRDGVVYVGAGTATRP